MLERDVDAHAGKREVHLEDVTKFRLPSGAVVYVETESLTSGESRAAIQTLFGSPDPKKPDDTAPDLKERLMPVMEALETVRSGIVRMTPDEITLEASLKFVGSAGVVLAKYGAEASVSVKLKWKKEGGNDGEDK